MFIQHRLDAKTRRAAYRKLLSVPADRYWSVALVGPVVALPLLTIPGAAVLGILGVVLATATTTDLLWKRILNAGTVAGLVWLSVFHAVSALGGVSAERLGLIPFTDAMAGSGICFGLMLVLHVLFRGGEGDVKLSALLGFALGGWHGVEALMAGYILAAGVAVLLLAGRRLTGHTGGSNSVPMAPFFTAGVLFTLLAN